MPQVRLTIVDPKTRLEFRFRAGEFAASVNVARPGERPVFAIPFKCFGTACYAIHAAVDGGGGPSRFEWLQKAWAELKAYWPVYVPSEVEQAFQRALNQSARDSRARAILYRLVDVMKEADFPHTWTGRLHQFVTHVRDDFEQAGKGALVAELADQMDEVYFSYVRDKEG